MRRKACGRLLLVTDFDYGHWGQSLGSAIEIHGYGSECFRACLRIPERGCVVLDQPRSFFGQPLELLFSTVARGTACHLLGLVYLTNAWTVNVQVGWVG